MGGGAAWPGGFMGECFSLGITHLSRSFPPSAFCSPSWPRNAILGSPSCRAGVLFSSHLCCLFPRLPLLQLMHPSLPRGAGSCLYLFSCIFIFIGGHSVGRSGLLARGVSHRDVCAQVLPVQILCVLDVVKEERKNNPLEIKIISVNRRQRVVFPVF